MLRTWPPVSAGAFAWYRWQPNTHSVTSSPKAAACLNFMSSLPSRNWPSLNRRRRVVRIARVVDHAEDGPHVLVPGRFDEIERPEHPLAPRVEPDAPARGVGLQEAVAVNGVIALPAVHPRAHA